jgi:serine/threonine-protein kinase OSR1/STK39
MKVLILTIQEEPPSLDTYDDDDGSVEEWTKGFQNIISMCLQKNPSKRPSCGELIQKHFSEFSKEEYRQMRRDKMRTEICDLVQDVGTSEVVSSPQFPRTVPIPIVSSMEEHRPAGTTWIFADGSQVLASSTTKEKTVDDVFDELDEFEKQTGGENYARAQVAAATTEEAEPDDLEDFMDEFEKTTAGENFRAAP